MPSQINNYKCPACNGPLHFAGESGRLQCDYCGSSYSVAEVEELYEKKQAQAEEAYRKEEEKRKQEAEARQKESAAREPEAGDAQQTEENWDESDVTSDWGEQQDRMRAYNCPSCGAELVCDETTAATSCPYCGNPTIIPGKFMGALKPDFVIPFRLSQEAAKAALQKHYQGKHLLPKTFRQENKISEIKGVYVPFWLYDGVADAHVVMEGEKVSVRRSGDYRITDTRHYHVERSGIVAYEKIPVDASTKMPDDYMDAIEPFDYDSLCPFSAAYLPGYLADQYDVDSRACSSRAEERMKNSAVSAMESDATGYDSKIVTQKHVNLRKGKVHYAMLPVYMLNTRWKDQDYLFAMNGQTGKMVSNLPISWGRFWSIFAGITLPLTGVIGTILYFIL